MMVKYILTYFNAKGVIEPARYLFAETGVDYEDKRIGRDDWPAYKKTNQTPFGQLPTLEVDGKNLCQSHTICRYLGRKLGIASKDEFEQAQEDMIAESIKDWHLPIVLLRYETDEGKREEAKQKLLTERLPVFLKAYEKLLGSKDYLVGNKLSWIDFVLAHNVGIMKYVKENILDDYPALKSYVQKIHDRPNIKKWIEKRPETEL